MKEIEKHNRVTRKAEVLRLDRTTLPEAGNGRPLVGA